MTTDTFIMILGGLTVVAIIVRVFFDVKYLKWAKKYKKENPDAIIYGDYEI